MSPHAFIFIFTRAFWALHFLHARVARCAHAFFARAFLFAHFAHCIFLNFFCVAHFFGALLREGHFF